MNVELKGTIHAIFAEEQISDNYKKKSIVISIEEETTYPQQSICHAGNTKIELLNGFQHGDKVKVQCNLKGKGSNGKYFNNLELWKIEKGN